MLKYCALVSLCAFTSLAADFLTGQGARLVIGQKTFTEQEAGASNKLLGGAGGVALANGTLFIADSNRLNFGPINNRVLAMDTRTFPGPTDEIDPNLGRCPVCLGEAYLVLGQPDFTKTEYGVGANKMRLPVGVASDGIRLAVADTLNNRVLIWNSIPTTINQPADVVVGQASLTQNKTPVVTDAKSLRAPQGVWMQGGRLYVADTQNHRVLIWNSIPTANEQVPDLVLGQDNFSSAVELDPIKQNVTIAADSILTPTSVTTDGVRLYVSDLGLNRVLIWNSLPTRNHQPADIVIGQPDMASHTFNNTAALCEQLDLDRDEVPDTDADGNPLYPRRCARTLNFPRFALSDGQKLFIADGGNDRVLIFNQIPTQNGPTPDVILGQPDEFSSVVTSVTDLFNPLLKQSAADVTPTPTSLAWDGQNLYVADPSNRRVLVFTAGEALLPINAVRNSASREIYALGTASIGLRQIFNPTTQLFEPGTIVAGDTVTLTINSRDYTYTMIDGDTVLSILQKLAEVVSANEGDPEVFAKYEPTLGLIKIQAKKGGTEGNDIFISGSTSEDAGIAIGVSGTTLQGGENASVIAPGTLVTMAGTSLAGTAVAANLGQEFLPLDLGDVQAYFDGIRSPLLYVSPTQVNAEVPWELLGSNSASFYLRIRRPDGSVVATTAIGVPIDRQNPGIFAEDGEDPRVAIAYHASSYATGLVTVDGAIEEGDVAVVTIQDRRYAYTVKQDDTLDSVRDALVAMVNSEPDEPVIAIPVGAFHRFQLRAKIPGPAGDGITYTATAEAGEDNSLQLVIFSASATVCCSNVRDTRVTLENPAIPGETIYFFATGLGPVFPADAQDAIVTGKIYTGPAINNAIEDVSSLGSGTTANIIQAGLLPGSHSIFKVVLQIGLGTTIGDSTYIGQTISQFIYTSNTVLIPIRNPNGTNFVPLQ